ncbi:MAG: ChbG/HpnK family deacetylase, partial [Terriglobia bacterium]
RAQIEFVLAAGLKPTHLDSHCHVHTRREAIFDRVVKLARQHGLAVRAHTQPLIEKLRQAGLPGNDHEVLDSYHIDSPHLAKGDKLYCFQQLLRELPPGLSEWAIHPGMESAELKAMEPTWEVRKEDLRFLLSPESATVVRDSGVVILNYRTLQKYWQSLLLS